MKYLTAEYEQELQQLAESLVTPARFGHVAVSQTVEVENLQGLWG